MVCVQQQFFLSCSQLCMCDSLMVSSLLGHVTAHLQAHMSLKPYDQPRLLLSKSIGVVTATMYAIVVMMDLIWQSLRRLSSVDICSCEIDFCHCKPFCL